MEIYSTAGGAAVCCGIMAFLMYHWGDWNSLLAALLGALLGWLLGVLLSPFKPEEDLFKSYSKAIGAFATGFLISKIDRVFELIMANPAGSDQPRILSVEVWRPFLFSLCSLILVSIYTFTTRHYGKRAESSDAKELAQFRAAKKRENQSAEAPPAAPV
jgi:hypothetical protein